MNHKPSMRTLWRIAPIIAIVFSGYAFGQSLLARMLSGVNYQTGTTYTFVALDTIRVTSFNNANPVAATLASGIGNFGAGTDIAVSNIGTGTVTITCTGCTINGASTLVLTTLSSADIYSDGQNYIASLGGGGGGGNANTLLGNTWASPGPIGATTPDQVTTTQLNFSGLGPFEVTSPGGTLASPGASAGGLGVGPGAIPQFNPNNLGWFNIPNLQDCGTTTTCAKTPQTLLIVRGSVAFPTATTVTVTALPFTSATSYSCTAGDATTAAGIINATTYTSGSSVTFTETGGANTDTARYICVGF